MKRRASWIIGAIAALTMGFGGGAAFAYFTSSGNGSGAASTGTLQAVTIASTGSVSSPLLPGGPAGNVTVEIANPNPYSVTLVSVNGNGTINTDGGHLSCTTTGVTFTNQTPNINIPANQTAYPVDLTGAISMSAAASNGCQGATFSVPISITVDK